MLQQPSKVQRQTYGHVGQALGKNQLEMILEDKVVRNARHGTKHR
jgi:translation initiation factor IF-1